MVPHSRVGSVYVLVAVALLGLAGCGGGGGGGDTPSSPVLAGPYAYALLFHDGVAGTVHTHTGLLDADAQGSLARPSLFVVGGGSEYDVANLPPATWTVGSDRLVSITGLGTIPLHGRIAEDGSLALVSSRAPDDPVLGILVERDPAPTLSKLAGAWTLASYGRVLAPGTLESRFGDVTIGATGTYTIDTSTYTYNVDGQVDPAPLFGVVEEVAVQPDGWVVQGLDVSTDVFRRGALSADGSLILLGGDAGALNLAGLTLLVRKRAAAASDLAGTYHACAFTTLTGGYLDGWGASTFYGGSRITWSFRANREGTYLDPATIDLGYRVDADGGTEFYALAGGGNRWLGAVGPGGGYAILAGDFQNGALPLLWMCLR